MSEQHTVEVTFEAEEVSTHTDKFGTEVIYKTPEGTYYVYIDARGVGDQAVLETGHHPHGFSERAARATWPELFEA